MSLNTSMFLILLVASILMLFVSYLSFRKRQLSVAKYSSLVMLAASFYSLGYAFEIRSTDIEHIKFWLKFEYIGIPFISTFWLILVIHYTGYQAILKKRIMLLLFSIPILTLILHYTNDIHHFYYRDILFDQSSTNLTSTLIKAPWYWVHITYNYVQAVAGMTLFLVMYLRALPIVRKQIIVMMLGTAAPWLSNLIYLFGNPEYKLDLTPLGFVLSGLFYLWGIYRFNLMRLVPIAMQTAFETMQDGVIILDYSNNITSVNQAAKHIFEELDQSQDRIDSAYSIFANYPEILSKIAEPGYSESRISFKRDQEIKYYNLKLSIIYDRGRTQLGKLIILNDITQVTVYQEELRSNANKLAELSAFKDKLFTVVAHDIRDPLAVLVNLIELLEEELEESGNEHSIVFQEVRGQVKGTFVLVENLLDWFRSQQGKINVRPLEWILASVVQQSIDNVKLRSEIKKIQITSDVADELLVFADKEMLDVVFRNLLSNAIKFTGIGGRIHIGATQEEGLVTVFVRDSGIGVDQEIAKSLFDDIQHIATIGTEGEKGTGFGLYLAGKFVQFNGGSIWVESVIDQGATFYFTIPAKESKP